MSDNFIEVKNIEKVEELLKDIPHGTEKAATRAINRTVTTLKKELKKKVSSEYGIKSGDIEKELQVSKAKYSNLTARIVAKGPTISLHRFFKSNTRKGITVLIKKVDGRKIVSGKPNLVGKAFLAKMRSGHTGIFQRNHKTRKVQYKNRSYNAAGITELKTLSIPQMLESDSIMSYLSKDDGITKVLEKNFEREIDKVLKGYVKK